MEVAWPEQCESSNTCDTWKGLVDNMDKHEDVEHIKFTNTQVGHLYAGPRAHEPTRGASTCAPEQPYHKQQAAKWAHDYTDRAVAEQVTAPGTRAHAPNQTAYLFTCASMCAA